MAKLAAYRAKRDFDRTREPKGDEGGATGGAAFVVQKHAARRLHYDLRLELDGVMKSWAITKGPSLVPGEKRLAVHVEDHPVEYNAFEGTIPDGQYGGGTVLLWDRGRWVANEDAAKGYAKGHLDFQLEGEKLTGSFHLVRIKKRPGEKQDSWLLIKQEDEGARAPEERDILEDAPRSVASGRTIEEIAADPEGSVWDSREGTAAEARAAKKGGAKAKRKAEASGPDLAKLTKGAPKRAMPKTLEPALASLASVVPASVRWLHEIKWDGYRLIAFKTADGVRLTTRRGLDWTERFPGIAKAVAALPVETAILDGEAVVEDERGVASFTALQNALSDEHDKIARAALLYAFDLLYLDGHDLRALPLEERKARLALLVPAGTSGHLRLSEHLDADGAAMAKSARALGLEGIISKRRDRPYRSGRSEDWLKTKFTEAQEFVIAGYVVSTASGKAIGSLALAYHEEGKLLFAGKVGTGFTVPVARMLMSRLEPLRRKTPALSEKLTTEDKRGIVWVEPQLVAEVEFRGWMGDRVRHASFKGLREDRPAEEIVRERAEATSPAKARPAKKEASALDGVRLTHPDRVLWPDVWITKQGLAEFYEEIAAWLLPHVAGRPLSLIRCPEGTAGACFFQKHAWAGLSDHIGRKIVRDEDGKDEELLYVEDIRGILGLVQASVLEIHPWGARIEDSEKADRITMDLDPGEDVPFADVIRAALDIRERLSAQGLESFVKTTGGKGLHVVLPLDGKATWPQAKAFAKSLAEAMEAEDPRRYIASASKKARRGLIYVDYLRNGRGATAIAAYSTRARARAPVSVPVAWDELTPALAPDLFTVETLPAQLGARTGDPWADLAALRQKLPAAKGSRAKRRASRTSA